MNDCYYWQSKKSAIVLNGVDWNEWFNINLQKLKKVENFDFYTIYNLLKMFEITFVLWNYLGLAIILYLIQMCNAVKNKNEEWNIL